MIPLKINGTNLIEIMLSASELQYYETKLGKTYANWTEEEIITCSLDAQVFPTEVSLDSEIYSSNAERTADYELENITIVNCKAKPQFTWNLIKASYVKNLLDFLEFKYDYKNADGVIVAEEAPSILVTYYDFNGMRTIAAYLGQSLSGTLVEYNNISYDNIPFDGKTLYWQSFRLAFPER